MATVPDRTRRRVARLAGRARRTATAGALALGQRRRERAANPLESYFENNTGRGIHKWMHYFDIYHRHFAPFRGRPITVVEFGVQRGGSTRMWREYFGPKTRIVGIDIDPRCVRAEGEQIEIVIGDQDDRDFVFELAERIGPVDVVIEDGGHHPNQQINTFEAFWPRITDGGVFLIEDLHTSYWEDYSGGLHRPGTFIEYAKDFLDKINAYHSRQPDFTVDDYTRTIAGMHVYDSIMVFDKATAIPKPTHRHTGRSGF